jgi:hypothetical protein
VVKHAFHQDFPSALIRTSIAGNDIPPPGVSSLPTQATAMSRRWNTQSLAVKLARHMAMGGLLGTVLAVLLVAMNVRNILGLISLSASPWVTGMVFVSVITLLCAVGATLTGLIFILSEEDHT